MISIFFVLNCSCQQEIVTQIAALKKQYREDLETLTRSYEGRRKALKDALLGLSNSPSIDNSFSNSTLRRK
jgi:hypothetical protein